MEGPARYIGAKVGHLAGVALALGLGGWPAILLPVATTVVGFSAARGLSDQFKQHVLLRAECAELMAAISAWCRGAAVVLIVRFRRGARSRSLRWREADGACTIPPYGR